MNVSRTNVAPANGPLEFRSTFLDHIHGILGMQRMRTPSNLKDLMSELIPERIKNWRSRIRDFFGGKKS